MKPRRIRPRQIAAEGGRLLILDARGRVWEHLTQAEGLGGKWGLVELPEEPQPPRKKREGRA